MKKIYWLILAITTLPIRGLWAESIVSAEHPAPEVRGDGYQATPGFRIDASQPALIYKAPPAFGAHGTFSAWINLDDPASASGPVFSAGSPESGWMLLQVGEGRLTFLLARGVKPYSGEGECYLNLSAPIDAIAAGRWHHIAVVWDANGPAQSLAALFIDGEVVEERPTTTLASGWGPETLFIGASSANAKAPRLSATLDSVGVFAFAAPPDQIRELAAGKVEGASLFIDFGNGCEAQDLRASDDDAAARAEARARWSR